MKTEAVVKWVSVLICIVLCMLCGCFLFLKALVNSCGPGLADYSIALQDHMELARCSSRVHLIVWDYEDEEAWETRKLYGYEELGGTIVESDVTQLGWNERYIVCFQSYSEMSSDHQRGWWIINTDLKTISGPLPGEEYRQKAEELGILDLEIKPPDDWDKNKVFVKP